MADAAEITTLGGGFSVVSHAGNEHVQITVTPRGALNLPPVIRSDDVDDLIEALLAAKPIAAEEQRVYEERQSEPAPPAKKARAARRRT